MRSFRLVSSKQVNLIYPLSRIHCSSSRPWKYQSSFECWLKSDPIIFTHSYYISQYKMQSQSRQQSLKTLRTVKNSLIYPKRSIAMNYISDCQTLEQVKFENIDALNPQLLSKEEMSPCFPEYVQSFYRLSSTLLSHTSITEINRIRLKAWLMHEAAAQGFSRDTYALSTFYIDLYFEKKGTSEIKDFQNVGIACFILAAKITESRLPRISFDIFNREQLLQTQKAVCQKLEFKLNPKTYVSLASELMILWDQFLEQFNEYYRDMESGLSICYFVGNRASFKNSRSFFERLDCMAMVLKTNDFKLNELILNAFFIENRINCLKIEKNITVQQVRDEFYKEEDEYYRRFIQFLKYTNSIELQPSCLKVEIGVYVSYFQSLKIDHNFVVSSRVSTILEFMIKQTENKRSHIVAKSVIDKLNRQEN